MIKKEHKQLSGYTVAAGHVDRSNTSGTIQEREIEKIVLYGWDDGAWDSGSMTKVWWIPQELAYLKEYQGVKKKQIRGI